MRSLERGSQGCTIARAGDNVAIALQENDANQVMSGEVNALAGNESHKMLKAWRSKMQI
ncbi:unnamed protein product [Brassica rapa subsp. trilocularis]